MTPLDEDFTDLLLSS